MNSILFRALLTIVAVTPSLAIAQAASPAPVELGSNLLQVALSLVLVVVLLIGSLYLIKRLSAPRGAAAGLLRVVAGAAVGTRERVVVVELGDTWLVLGVAPGRVTPLHQLPRQTVDATPSANSKGMDFAGWLRQVTERRNAR